MDGGGTAPIYFNSTIVLFIGGFMIALTMEKWNLHKRIALNIIHAVGGGPARIVLGFMIAAAFLSMWISNTATAVMMGPIGLAIVLKLEDAFGVDRSHAFTVSLMLGIAYASSLGGLTTLVGTPPNLSFVRIFAILFPEAPPIAFGQWLVMAFPIGVVMLLTAWLKSIGLSLELVIVFGTLILAALFILVHYHRRILLFFAPWLGGLGRSIQARWGAEDAAH